MEIQLQVLRVTEILISVACLIQSLEYFSIRKAYSETGIWQFKTINLELIELPKVLGKALGIILKDRCFLVLISLRTIVSVTYLCYAHWILPVFLFVSTLLICIRWRGTYNGGSDYMTVVILAGVSFARIFPNSKTALMLALWYIALQSISSYFIAGIAKLRSDDWKSKNTLQAFITSSIYINELPSFFHKIAQKHGILFGRIAVLFECAFPFCLLNTTLCILLLSIGTVFHLVNAYLFGLNRFLIVWLASYPAIFWAQSTLYN